MMESLLLRRCIIIFLASLIAKYAFGAAPESQAPAEAGKESPVAQGDKQGKENEAKEDKAEKKDVQPAPPVVTEHTVALAGGKTLSYKAIAGYLLLRDTKEEAHAAEESEKNAGKQSSRSQTEPAKGKPKADIFFVAYLLNGVADVATRPVTFAFNGGPGSASVWLHMGG